MASSFGWLDFSEKDRRTALDVISLFGEQETVDELGLGSVRDAIADQLFPGTSTIQTRARYFLFVPWLYLDLESRRVSSSRAADYARAQEIKLIRSLLGCADTDGLIGKLAKQDLKRLPSNIYWEGLRSWGILLSKLNQPDHHRKLDDFYSEQARLETDDQGEAVAGVSVRNWCVDIPKSPEGFPDKADFHLLPNEARFLQTKILACASGSMLAFLVGRAKPFGKVPFPWRHPHFGTFPVEIRSLLKHAQNFSEMMNGALLLYNLMLAEKTQRAQEISYYRETLQKWAAQIHLHRAQLGDWDLHDFWILVTTKGSRVLPATRHFVESVINQVRDPKAAKTAAENKLLRRLIEDREKAHKGAHARLFDPHAQDRWRGESGTRPMDYRWTQAQNIILDIVNPLASEKTHA